MRRAVLCAALLAVGCALIVQQPGCSEGSHYALLRSLGDGSPSIDRYHWSTCDTSWYHGHFYAAKGPGVALASLPLYAVLHAAGLVWNRLPPDHLEGIPGKAVWPFTVALVVLAVFGLFLLLRRAAELVAPGYGTTTAVMLTFGSMLLPYSTLFNSHLPSVLLGFGAFSLLLAERRGAASLRHVALAGVLAGLAIVFEPPLGLVAVALAAYAASRRPVASRLAAYGAGGLVGIAPLLAFDLWAFGSVVHQPYDDTVSVAGQTGHDQIGANANGFFGIGSPSLVVAARLLFLNHGLLVATPLAAAALGGLVLLARRRAWRAEATLISALVILYLVYNAAYYQPFGGDAAGPRFLMPLLPFFVLPLAAAVERFPLTTSLLAAVSLVMMVAATVTQPMLQADDTKTWFADASHGRFADTVLTRLGVASHTVAILPTLVLFISALAIAYRWRRPSKEDVRVAVAAVAVWAVVASVAPPLLRQNAVATVSVQLTAYSPSHA